MTQTLSASAYRRPPEAPIISIRDLHHRYGKQGVEAIATLNLDIYPGEIFGLIGPDGAGKTTTFQILSGVMTQTAGEVDVLGENPRDARLQIGYLTQRFSLYQDLSVWENLRYTAGLHEVSDRDLETRGNHYLSLLDLDRFKDRLAGRLSGGMKQKLALCCTLVHQPRILLLDEPTTGVDPVSRREFWDILVQLAASEGMTTVVATPYLDEAERCSRIALMYAGRIQQCDTVAQIKASLGVQRLEVYLPVAQLDRAEDVLHQNADVQDTIADVQRFGDRLDVLTAQPRQTAEGIRRILTQHEILVEAIEQDSPTLENTFVSRLRTLKGEGSSGDYPRIYSIERSVGTAIGARNLNRTFGDFHAVKDIQLDIQYGEVFGLLGANGAGKTTTIKMLCGLLPVTSGTVMLAGESGELRSRAVRQQIGYMSQKFTLYDDLTIDENLEFYCGVYGIPQRHRRAKKDWVLRISDLTGQADRMTADLPGGWKQRVAFGAAVIHEPRIVFLDEPTSGVDPLARRQFWRWINEFARQGMAILVTTHYLEEAEQCHRLGFMVAGELVAQGTPRQVKAEQPGQLVEWECEPLQQASDVLKQRLERWRVSIFGSRLHTVLEHPERYISHIEEHLRAVGVQVRGHRAIAFSLEDVFISVVEQARRRGLEVSDE
ncbi:MULTISPECIES: ATP-binding cassette domain-containing protein [unclassified Leptolyngbya]|uniref:ATP-binding cassette domain-containing protein n=1 Tax=unclassified Leptolyngbya TaxID=2650499 RepID=UPI0016835DA2|nr:MULTISPECIES: ATP-binding cassette domain-containing protein [unclassified Leptolyngbya]MBD1909004.1 ABC transporter ATP-binding protein [Leptolyngbya sp. FACHB-8]MBD2158096.1 ABC transporter ATP-binding protein [Leptolyngbya sp. FACHB-16]